MWIVPFAYVCIGVLFVLVRRNVMRDDGAGVFDVLFAVVFWPMHAAFVDDADRVMSLDARFERFKKSIERVRAESDRLARAIATHDAKALEDRLAAMTDIASAQTLRQHLRDLHRARDQHAALLTRIGRIEELERTLSLRFELAEVLPHKETSEIELLLVDAEAELELQLDP